MEGHAKAGKHLISLACARQLPLKGKPVRGKKERYVILYNYLPFMAEMERFASIFSQGSVTLRAGRTACEKIKEFASVCTGSCTCQRACADRIRISPSFLRQNKKPAEWRAFRFGGDGEIRTLEELLTPTRFPIVRARPTTRHLRVAQETRLFICQPAYYNAAFGQSQGII